MPVARVRLPYRCKADGFDSITVLESHHSLPMLTAVMLLHLVLGIVPVIITHGAERLRLARAGMIAGERCAFRRKLSESRAG